MDSTYLIMILMFLLLTIGVNVTDCWLQYKTLIKEGKLIKRIPTWKDTKKPMLWYVVWSIIFWFDLVGFLIVALIVNSTELLIGVYFLTVPPYLIIYELAYGIIYLIIIKKSKKTRLKI